MFALNDNNLRNVMIDGEPWFVASDICRCLGLLLDKGTNAHVRKLDKDERLMVAKSDKGPAKFTGSLFIGTESRHTLVSESGLYKLIMRAQRADRPWVVKFQDWVTREVLPAIRKTGGYLLNEDMRDTAAADSREEFPPPASFGDALRKLADEVDRREAAEKLSRELAGAREADAPKVESFNALMNAEGNF